VNRRKNYRKLIKNIETEYFDLKHALFAFNDFEDGVYHIRGEFQVGRGRLHHLIGVKLGSKLHIFDYAKDNDWRKLWHKCNINKNPHQEFSYELEFCTTKVQDIDLKAIYLGPIKRGYR
jgi:hypothetical protein